MWLDATPGTQSNFTSSYAAEVGIHNVDIQIVNRAGTARYTGLWVF